MSQWLVDFETPREFWQRKLDRYVNYHVGGRLLAKHRQRRHR
jgi:hypothetical protein